MESKQRMMGIRVQWGTYWGEEGVEVGVEVDVEVPPPYEKIVQNTLHSWEYSEEHIDGKKE